MADEPGLVIVEGHHEVLDDIEKHDSVANPLHLSIVDLVLVQYLVGALNQAHLGSLEAFTTDRSLVPQREVAAEVHERVLLLTLAPLHTELLLGRLSAELWLLLHDLPGRFYQFEIALLTHQCS